MADRPANFRYEFPKGNLQIQFMFEFMGNISIMDIEQYKPGLDYLYLGLPFEKLLPPMRVRFNGNPKTDIVLKGCTKDKEIVSRFQKFCKAVMEGLDMKEGEVIHVD
jgi:hypothetical protein